MATSCRPLLQKAYWVFYFDHCHFVTSLQHISKHNKKTTQTTKNTTKKTKNKPTKKTKIKNTPPKTPKQNKQKTTNPPPPPPPPPPLRFQRCIILMKKNVENFIWIQGPWKGQFTGNVWVNLFDMAFSLARQGGPLLTCFIAAKAVAFGESYQKWF